MQAIILQNWARTIFVWRYSLGARSFNYQREDWLCLFGTSPFAESIIFEDILIL